MGISVISFSENTVKKIATNVTTGKVNKHRTKGRNMQYIATYRATGQTAPSAAQMKNEGYVMFQDHPEQEEISESSPIDVYVLCSDGSKIDNIGTLVAWT